MIFMVSILFCYGTNYFPVHGHAGVLVFGFIGVNKTPVVLMNGRAQYRTSPFHRS